MSIMKDWVVVPRRDVVAGECHFEIRTGELHHIMAFPKTLIAKVSPDVMGGGDVASLLAAAPDLLEAVVNAKALLENIQREIGYCTIVTQKWLGKLIEKAEGAES